METQTQNQEEEKTIYWSCSETAKFIRNELKKHFPKQKFSVRSSVYSGGSSIDINWTDGVGQEEVDNIVKQYNGSGFDGMIDLKYYRTHWILPDGSIQLAKSEGTESSRGIYPKIEIEKPHPEARKISLGADYIFTNREISIEIQEKTAKDLAKLNNIEFISMNQYPEGFGEKGDNWYIIIWRLLRNQDLNGFKGIISTKKTSGRWEEFYEVDK